MNKQLVDELVAAIKQNLAKDENMISILSEIICLGKEAIYRRLRGEVDFSFEEIVRISLRFKISLDELASINNTKKAIFDMKLHQLPQSNLYNLYYKNLLHYIEIFQLMNHAKKSRLRSAANTIPFYFLLAHRNLSRFRLYKLIYQMESNKPKFPFSLMEPSAEIEEAEKQLYTELRQVERVYYILDNNVILSTVRDIEYFHGCNMVSDKELQLLKKELLLLMDELESITVSGTSNNSDVEIYLSDADFDMSYIHCEYDEHEYCLLRAYWINFLSTRNAEICQIQKDWIESLKCYSVLITKSGENKRYQFIKDQRELIMKLGARK